jgi:hypothetical protein
MAKRNVLESRPRMLLAFFPLPARGLGTRLTLARQRPVRLRSRSAWLQLQGKAWWAHLQKAIMHARFTELSVASPPVVPPVDALRHWRTQVLRQADRRGARADLPHRARPLRRAE